MILQKSCYNVFIWFCAKTLEVKPGPHINGDRHCPFTVTATQGDLAVLDQTWSELKEALGWETDVASSRWVWFEFGGLFPTVTRSLGGTKRPVSTKGLPSQLKKGLSLEMDNEEEAAGNRQDQTNGGIGVIVVKTV